MASSPLPPPRTLRCEYLLEPLGVDARLPRLSWTLSACPTDVRPAACQIILSTSLPKILRREGDLWDSGRRRSKNLFQVEYGGPPLEGSRRYFWRVRWWDDRDRVSRFSRASFFETGILDPSAWQASWIGSSESIVFRSPGTTLSGIFQGDYVQTHAAYLRKEFSLRPGWVAARVYVCGLGYYELRLNGRRVGDRALDPAWTDYLQAALYSTYDVCRLLQPGGNAAAVLLGNGRHIKNYGYGRPKLFLQLEVDYRDGSRLCLTSGRDWKASSGPLLENSVYGGQTHDARLERESWDRPGFDDRLWRPAVPREPSPLASQMMPPVRAVCRLKPRRIQPREGGAVLCDFGQNHSGWTRLSVRGRRGDRIEIRHAELLGEDGGLNTAPNQGAEARDVFILGGGRREILEPRFTYHGFRYAEIRGLRHRLHPDDVSSPVVHSDVRTTGSFHCSHPLLNRLQRNIRWGLLSNLMSIPTDCPQRDERHGWLGDAHLAAETAILNFDMAAFYAKFLDDIRRAQRPDGSLPDFAPPYFKLTYPADPAWASAYAQLAWLLYFYYGDTRVLEIHYPFLKKYMDFLDRSSAGRLPLRLGKYGDWCPPGSVGPKKTPVELTASWYHLHDLRLLQKISRVLGREKDERRFALRAEKTEAAFHKAFLGPEGYAWVKFGPADSVAGQTSQILPLALGIVPPRKKSLVLGKLLGSLTFHHDLHPDTGILGARYLLEVLTEQGHLRDAFRVATRETYPGWGYMIREGATTLWERWENVAGGGMNSHNHIMLGSIGAWFFKTLAGLKCLAPVWERIGFSPPDIPDLDSASARLETIRGTVEARWRREGSSLRLSIRIPPGAKAEVRLPRLWPGGTLRANGNIVWLHGRPTKPAPGLQHAGADKESIRLLAEGGPYDFLLAKTFSSAGR